MMATKTTNLFEILRQKGFTQEELAKKLGCSQQAISKWCQNSAAPRARDIAKVAAALDVSKEEILACFE